MINGDNKAFTQAFLKITQKYFKNIELTTRLFVWWSPVRIRPARPPITSRKKEKGPQFLAGLFVVLKSAYKVLSNPVELWFELR